MTLRTLLAGSQPVVAPLALDPLSAKLAQEAGFEALYVGGGAVGYLKCVTEANLGLSEMAALALDIRTVCGLPLILDGAAGWGDPMHMHRTIRMSEAAGFAAIEIEDQILPKRAHHHIGVEHLIPQDVMVAKIAECAAARTDPDFLLIARTNAARTDDIDTALRRAEAYRRAGADMILILSAQSRDIRLVGERLGAPLMYMPSGKGLWTDEFSLTELGSLGYRLVVDPTTPTLSIHAALSGYYARLKRGIPDPLASGEARKSTLHALHETIGLEDMLDVERRTVERPIEGSPHER